MMNLELILDGMTWGELRRFVALSSESNESEVLYGFDDQMERFALVLADLEVPDGA